MAKPEKTGRIKTIPEPLRSLFWEYDLSNLSLEQDRDLIINRVLASGSWDHVQWLRSEFNDNELKNCILNSDGRNLTPPRLRFWELLLDLPHSRVNRWLSRKNRRIWDGRAAS